MAVSCWPSSSRASSAPTTGSIVAATDTGAASMRRAAAKNAKLASSTVASVRASV
jgi:hypothetical protein